LPWPSPDRGEASDSRNFDILLDIGRTSPERWVGDKG